MMKARNKENDKRVTRVIDLLNGKKVEVLTVDSEPTGFMGGVPTKYAHVHLVDGEYRSNNLAITVRTDEHGQYLDFSKTRYKEFGKVSLYLI